MGIVDTAFLAFVAFSIAQIVPREFDIPGSAPGCRTGNREKLSSTQAEPVQAIKSGVAYFPSISCTTSWRRSRYFNLIIGYGYEKNFIPLAGHTYSGPEMIFNISLAGARCSRRHE